MQSFFSHRYAIPATLVLILATTVALSVNAYKALTVKDNWNQPTTISVTGISEIMAIPDIAQFSFSVQAEGPDATTAQTESATHINTIIAFLEGAGIAKKDIQTVNYNLFPKYRYEQRPCSPNFCPSVERISDGFEVTQRITVKIRDVDQAGNLLTGIGNNGATDISELNFTVDDREILKEQARAKAIKDAEIKAKILAKNLNLRIKRLISYYEDEAQMPNPYYAMGGDRMESQTMTVAPDVPTGEMVVTSRVNLVYELK